MKKSILIFILFIINLQSSKLKPFECKELYIFNENEDEIVKNRDFQADILSNLSLDIKLSNFAYNVVDNFIYAMVVDPMSLKGWSRYDIVRIDSRGDILNLGTPLFKSGESIYDAFRVGNGTIDSFGYYYSLGDPISIDPNDSRRAILYIVYIGDKPSAGSLKFDKKSLKILNFYKWTPPKDIAYLNSNQKLYGVGGKSLFEVDTKKFTIKKLKIENSYLLKKLEVSNIWEQRGVLNIYAKNRDRGSVFKLKFKSKNRVKLIKLREVNLYSLTITSCTSPSLLQKSSKSSVKMGDSIFYNFEIKNPLPYPIKVKFVSNLTEGISFDDSIAPNIKSSNFYFSPSQIRVDELSIPKLEKVEFKLKANVDKSLNRVLDSHSYIIFRGVKYLAKSGDQKDILLNTPSILLKERLIENKDEDRSGDISIGDTLLFSIKAINNGETTLKSVQLNAPKLKPNSKECRVLESNGVCSFEGEYKVSKDDEKRAEVSIKSYVYSQNLPKKYAFLVTPVVRDSVDLKIELKTPKEIISNQEANSYILLKNQGSTMATDITINLKAPDEINLNSKKFTISYIDSGAVAKIPIKFKAKRGGEFSIEAIVSSEDRDINLSNNRVLSKLNIRGATQESSREFITSTSKIKGRKNTPPIAKDDEITIPPDSRVWIDISKGVLGNDRDRDGDILKVVSFELDSNGDGVEEKYLPKDLVSIYGVGRFTMLSDGSFEFEPIDGYMGYIPTITYNLSDGRGGYSSAKLLLSIEERN